MSQEVDHRRAFVFPGQGTQQVGMSEYLIRYRNPDIATLANRIYEEADDILQAKLSSFCLSGPDAQLDRPEITQPAILVTSIAALIRIFTQINSLFQKFCAGLSASQEW